MKMNYVLFILGFMLLGIPSLQAQTQPPVNESDYEYNGTSTKFAVMVPDVLHFKAGVETGERMKLTENNYKFEMVIIGELSKAIVEDESLKDFLDRGIKAGMDFSICEYALDLMGIDKSKVDKRIKIVPNGWLQMYELKDKGYNTIRS